MKNLANFLEKFSKLLNKGALIKENIIKVVQEKTKVILSPEQINLKEGVLEIKAGGVAKSELNLKEEIIKTELKKSYQIFISRILYK